MRADSITAFIGMCGAMAVQLAVVMSSSHDGSAPGKKALWAKLQVAAA
jgi:hypothetical protein